MARGGQQNVNNKQAAGTSNASSMEDSSSPFYLHNGDHPGLVLVSHLLTASHYKNWSRVMLMALTAKNEVGFVDRSKNRPSSNHLLFGVWNCCNSMVISWILNSVFKEIAGSLLYIENASDICTNIRDRFHQSDGTCTFQVEQFIGLNQGSLDVNGYFTRLKFFGTNSKNISSC